MCAPCAGCSKEKSDLHHGLVGCLCLYIENPNDAQKPESCRQRGIGHASLRGLSRIGASDRAKPWSGEHIRCRFQHLYQYRGGNHYHWRCLFFYGIRSSSDNSRPNRWLSCCNRAESTRGLGDSEWSSLYNSRVWSSRGDKYWGGAGWNIPSWLLCQSWRSGYNRKRDSY